MLTFLDIPWFIQNEIMELALTLDQDLHLLDKSWFGFKLHCHGTVKVNSSSTQTSPILNSIISHTKSIEFRTASNVNWDLLSKFHPRSITELTLTSFRDNDFIILNNDTRFKKFEYITKLTLQDSVKDLDGLRKVLVRFRLALNEIVIDNLTRQSSCLFATISFPVLSKLEFGSNLCRFYLNDLSVNLPRLKSLHIHNPRTYLMVDTLPIFNDVEELVLVHDDAENPIGVDLNHFPRLNILRMNSGIQYINATISPNLKELAIYKLPVGQVDSLFQPGMNIRKLQIAINSEKDEDDLKIILRACERLSHLELDYTAKRISFRGRFLSVTHLKLRGHLYFNMRSVLLLSSFNLQHLVLEAHQYRIFIDQISIHGFLPHLNHLKIISKDADSLQGLENFFNNNLLPNVQNFKFALQDSCDLRFQLAL